MASSPLGLSRASLLECGQWRNKPPPVFIVCISSLSGVEGSVKCHLYIPSCKQGLRKEMLVIFLFLWNPEVIKGVSSHISHCPWPGSSHSGLADLSIHQALSLLGLWMWRPFAWNDPPPFAHGWLFPISQGKRHLLRGLP